jgi:hypothetical protein
MFEGLVGISIVPPFAVDEISIFTARFRSVPYPVGSRAPYPFAAPF